VMRNLDLCGVNLLTEPLWQSLLRRICDQDTMFLRSKTHIPVKQGCLLMGAPDPLALLEDGQMFLRIRRPVVLDEDGYDNCRFKRDCDGYMVILGAVNIYRNPCLDPGDFRIVQAVNRTELYEWMNVLLLPASNSCQRSLSSEC
jgi:hypothetical protein